jgi:hypothetical protein
MVKKRYYVYLVYSWVISFIAVRIDKLEIYLIGLATLLFIMLDINYKIIERLKKGSDSILKK